MFREWMHSPGTSQGSMPEALHAPVDQKQPDDLYRARLHALRVRQQRPVPDALQAGTNDRGHRFGRACLCPQRAASRPVLVEGRQGRPCAPASPRTGPVLAMDPGDVPGRLRAIPVRHEGNPGRPPRRVRTCCRADPRRVDYRPRVPQRQPGLRWREDLFASPLREPGPHGSRDERREHETGDGAAYRGVQVGCVRQGSRSDRPGELEASSEKRKGATGVPTAHPTSTHGTVQASGQVVTAGRF